MFLYRNKKIYVGGSHKKCLIEALLMSTHNIYFLIPNIICFREEIKNKEKYFLIPPLILSCVLYFRIPMNMYFLLAFLTVATMGLSNTSVGYLNYPTQVIFKCCKLIPVMIGGVLIQGKNKVVTSL